MIRSITNLVRVARHSVWLAALANACGGGSEAAAPRDSTITANAVCDAGNGGITLPPGFCATVFADGLSTPRHIAVSDAGDVYVMQYGGGVVGLRDTDKDGHSDVRATVGRSGQTGIAIRGTDLYADVGIAIVRYRLTAGTLQPSTAADTIVRGLPTGEHDARNIALDANGNLFVNVGSNSNVCENSTHDPCGELPTRAAIFRYSASQTGQSYLGGERYASGIRNAVGLAMAPDGRLWATQHGRDDLYQKYPQLFTATDGAENPAEELMVVNRADDFGWPYCYYDFKANHLVLAPEYGGDRVQVGRCSTARAPVTAFPGHWAPDGLVFYAASQFPSHYRNGAFVAFHGSWNRSPQPQAGFRVAFVPAAGSSLSSSYETFADGFAGASTIINTSSANHRPTGLAVGPDGALYVTDDKGGRVWRIVYRGN